MSHDDDLMTGVPEPGLPEKLPEDEHILWQGRPQVWALTCESLNLKWVIGYFVLVWLWWAGTLTDQISFAQALVAASPLLALCGIVVLLLLGLGWAQAASATYTITDKRVVMRIGAALTMTLNLPYSRIASAELSMGRGGIGTIALDLTDTTKLSYLVCWPHARPWFFRKPQPALRCVPEAARVAGILGEAAEAVIHAPRIERIEAPGEAPPQSPAAPAATGGNATVAAE
ncbi:MAG: photosynthetic complex putative assembly protein PuhB [Pseudomonadota bacterium]